MKLRNHQFSIQPRIFSGGYKHPWYEYMDTNTYEDKLIRPNPPSKEAVKRAKFVDKTYHWKGGNSSIRSGN